MSERRALHAEPLQPTGSPTYAYIVMAGLLMVVAVAGATMIPREAEPVRLAPVLAQAPTPEADLASPAAIAAMPAGMPVWPAVFAGQQAAWHFAEDQRAR
jgi:hypothetical protein